MDNKTNEDITNLYNQFKEWTEEGALTTTTVVKLTTDLMAAVQTLVNNKNKGQYKKEIVIKVLQLLINDAKISQSSKTLLLTILETTIPITIDIIVSVAKGEIDIGKLLKQSFCCKLN